MNMQGTTEEMTYGEEEDRATAVVVELTDKYHGNDNHGGDNNDVDEGGDEFEEDRKDDGVGGRSQCTGYEEGGGF